MYCAQPVCSDASFRSQNPQADLQAQDRCHRIGQTKPVLVYRLVTANTIDQKILERASAKRKLEQMVIHKSEWLHLEMGCANHLDLILRHNFAPRVVWNIFQMVSFLLLLSSTDKFKGGKAELNQSKSCIDLDELMELLKARGTEKWESILYSNKSKGLDHGWSLLGAE